jgi:hypothetical protein
MTEIFFVLTVIYAAYVIVVAVRDNKKPHVIDDSAPAMWSVTNDVKPLISEKPMAQIIEKPVVKATVKVATTKTGLKNPQTGEIATSYANYRFMKRWIKEALVTEGLLEKIYKNNELTPEIESEIKAAMVRLEKLENYQA